MGMGAYIFCEGKLVMWTHTRKQFFNTLQYDNQFSFAVFLVSLFGCLFSLCLIVKCCRYLSSYSCLCQLLSMLFLLFFFSIAFAFLVLFSICSIRSMYSRWFQSDHQSTHIVKVLVRKQSNWTLFSSATVNSMRNDVSHAYFLLM